MHNIEIYEDYKGKSEVYEYICKLQKSKTKDDRIKSKKISMYLQLLQNNGLSLEENYIKNLEKDIWELRPIRDRILFAKYGNDFVLLSVFVKKTQKTPKNEIRKAKKHFENYKKMKEKKDEKF